MLSCENHAVQRHSVNERGELYGISASRGITLLFRDFMFVASLRYGMTARLKQNL
jgi:hypothetical protein